MSQDNSASSEGGTPGHDINKMGEVGLFTARELQNLKIIHPESDDRQLLKIFRELRTRLYKGRVDKNFVCLVTSVCPKGGASFIARNLAATVTLDTIGTTVLLDCNLYAPSTDILLPLKSMIGLTDYLRDESVRADDIIYATGIPRLRVVPVGNHCDGATEALMSSRMRDLVNDIKFRYSDRVILIDAPSVGEYGAETRILVELCDMVLLVVPDDMVSESEINEAIESIGREKIFGMVLNNVNP